MGRYANHGAGIFTSLGHKNGVNVERNIPAPWFASGYIYIYIPNANLHVPRCSNDTWWSVVCWSPANCFDVLLLVIFIEAVKTQNLCALIFIPKESMFPLISGPYICASLPKPSDVKRRNLDGAKKEPGTLVSLMWTLVQIPWRLSFLPKLP